jgi:hypothetical protein
MTSVDHCILVKIFNKKNQILNLVCTTCSSYFDFPRCDVLLVVLFNLFFTKCTTRRHFSFFKSRARAFSVHSTPSWNFIFQCVLLLLSPLVHSLLSRSPVPKPATSLIGGFAFCVLFGFHRSAAGQRLLSSVSRVVSGFASLFLTAGIFLLPHVDQLCLTRTVFPFVF